MTELKLPASFNPNRFEAHKRGFYKAFFKYDESLIAIVKQWPGMRGGKGASGYYWETPCELAPMLAEKVLTFVGRKMTYPELRSVAKASFYDKLHPYQQALVKMKQEQGCAWAFFKAGLGKSPAALASREGTTVIVCPANVRGTWKDEIEKWLPDSSIYVHKPGPKGWLYDGEEFIVVSYEMLAKVLDLLPIKIWGFICDEAHYLKSYTSVRTQAVSQFVKEHPEAVLLGLTATPAPDTIEDFYQPIHTLTPWRLGKPGADNGTFRDRYFELERSKFSPRGIVRGLREDTKEELARRINGIGIQATMEEWGHLMQPITSKVIHIEDHWTEEEREASLRRIEEYHNTGSTTILEQHTEATAAVKMEATIAYVKELVEAGHKKIAVVTYNRSVAASLHGSLARTRGIDHEVTLLMAGEGDRDARMTKMLGEELSIAVAPMDSIRQGVNKLVQFDQVVLVQLYWSPVNVIQVLGRFLRLTSIKPVTVHLMQLDGTLDVPIRKTLAAKMADTNEVIKAGDGERVIGDITAEKQEDWQSDLRNAIGD